MNDLTAEELEQLREAYEAATTGQWAARNQQTHLGAVAAETYAAWCLDRRGGTPLYGMRGTDANDLRFISLAHNLMPKLLAAAAERDKLRAALATAKSRIQTLVSRGDMAP